MTPTSIPHARLEWRNGQPYSAQFGDVYFSSDNGLLETEYVFLQGNRLVERWQHQTAPFTIIETGFGTGLNFLCACRLWLASTTQATLHFISVEKFPLSINDMQKAWHMWPTLQPLSSALLDAYASLLNGAKSANLFAGRVQLTLLIGDAQQTLATAPYNADAWFLDGFAPSKNPDMWQDSLFRKMAQHSHAGTTFATFTSAGHVRRGLSAAGFVVQKRPGFGRKREMLTGVYQSFSNSDLTVSSA